MLQGFWEILKIHIQREKNTLTCQNMTPPLHTRKICRFAYVNYFMHSLIKKCFPSSFTPSIRILSRVIYFRANLEEIRQIWHRTLCHMFVLPASRKLWRLQPPRASQAPQAASSMLLLMTLHVIWRLSRSFCGSKVRRGFVGSLS